MKFKEALVVAGIPFTSFAVDYVPQRWTDCRRRGSLHSGSLQLEPVTTAVLDDTCGNLIQLSSHD